MKTLKIFLMALTISSAVSGCFTKKTALVGGPGDLIFVPKGGEISNVPLPTNEGKTYTVVTPKPGYWVSMQGWNRVIKATSGSAPEKKEGKQ